MKRSTFGSLSLLAFGLVLVSFVVLGVGRIVLPYRAARLLAAPPTLAAAVLVAYLFAWSVLVALGVREFDE